MTGSNAGRRESRYEAEESGSLSEGRKFESKERRSKDQRERDKDRRLEQRPEGHGYLG